MVICDTHYIALLRKAVGWQPALFFVVVVQGPIVSHHQTMHVSAERNLVQVHFLSCNTYTPDSSRLDFELKVAFVLM